MTTDREKFIENLERLMSSNKNMKIVIDEYYLNRNFSVENKSKIIEMYKNIETPMSIMEIISSACVLMDERTITKRREIEYRFNNNSKWVDGGTYEPVKYFSESFEIIIWNKNSNSGTGVFKLNVYFTDIDEAIEYCNNKYSGGFLDSAVKIVNNCDYYNLSEKDLCETLYSDLIYPIYDELVSINADVIYDKTSNLRELEESFSSIVKKSKLSMDDFEIVSYNDSFKVVAEQTKDELKIEHCEKTEYWTDVDY